MNNAIALFIFFVPVILILAGTLLIGGNAYAENYKYDTHEQIEI